MFEMRMNIGYHSSGNSYSSEFAPKGSLAYARKDSYEINVALILFE